MTKVLGDVKLRGMGPKRSSCDCERDDDLVMSDVPVFDFSGQKFEGARVAKVHDADSIVIAARVGPKGDYRRIKCRLYGLDACEIGSDDGRAARTVLVDSLGIERDPKDQYGEKFFTATPSYIDVWCHHFDKYGRTLVEVARPGGMPLNASLCAESPHFTEYDGRSARPHHHH